VVGASASPRPESSAAAERERLDAIRRRRESPERYIEYQRRAGEAVLGHLRRFLDPRGARLLEVGCGSAGIAMTLAAAGMRAHGVDRQQYDSPLPAARDYARARGIGLDLVRGDAAWLPYRTDSFDGVVASSVIEHLDDPGRSLLEIARVLTPGGRAFVDFPLFRGPYGGHIDDVIAWPWFHLLPARWVTARLRDRGAIRELEVFASLNRISHRAFRRLVRTSGLEVVEFRRLHYLTHPGRKLLLALLAAARRAAPGDALRALRDAGREFRPAEALAFPLLVVLVPLARLPWLEEWTATGVRYVLRRRDRGAPGASAGHQQVHDP
jgi:ubiquinone/menaquinone biosynthesis C-methylase UbiE